MTADRATAAQGRGGPFIRPRCLGLLAALVALVVLLTRACGAVHRPAQELARRGACKANLFAIYDALREYRDVEGRLPETLDELVRREVIVEALLHCPSELANLAGGPTGYAYHPEAWGTAAPVVTEDCRNHAQHWPWYVKRLAADLPPQCYALFSDGSVRDMAHGAEVVLPPRPQRGHVGPAP